MKKLHRLFADHPASVGESYTAHATSALGFAWRLQLASLAALVHALVPFLCVKTASAQVATLHQRMLVNRARHTSASR